MQNETYEKLIDLCADESKVIKVLRYLRKIKIVHFKRLGEIFKLVQYKLAQRKFYMNKQCGLVDKIVIVIKNNTL